MLNPQFKLNPQLLIDDLSVIEQAPIRKGFGIGLLHAGEKDTRVVGLCADLTESTQMNLFKEKFPNRFVEIGVAEQNLASVASGMAAMGKIPAITSYAMFSPGRNWEQIRTTICYNDQKVVIAGSHAGISVGPDGGTHQAIEDIALTRVIPNMAVFSPCDVLEAQKITECALSDTISTPSYIRLAREKTPIITTADTPFEYTKASLYFVPSPECISKNGPSAQIGIIATGGLVYNALRAAHILEQEGYSVKVLYLLSIKPIDKDAIISLAHEVQALVTVEEHQIAGGVGSAVSEVIMQYADKRPPIEYIGIHDQFGQSGTPLELIEHYGMGITHIVAAAKKSLGRA
jgi:transketolase